jgi:hypothetical protein
LDASKEQVQLGGRPGPKRVRAEPLEHAQRGSQRDAAGGRWRGDLEPEAALQGRLLDAEVERPGSIRVGSPVRLLG